jgi:hypothetical protein
MAQKVQKRKPPVKPKVQPQPLTVTIADGGHGFAPAVTATRYVQTAPGEWRLEGLAKGVWVALPTRECSSSADVLYAVHFSLAAAGE